jgi:hypothetical protein
MTRDAIEGFMFGLGAGFVIAHLVKPPETASPASGDIRHSSYDNFDDGFDDGAKRLRKPAIPIEPGHERLVV